MEVVMIKNRIIALAFRLIALAVISVGFMNQLGFFRGRFDYDMFKWYTIQSNLLAAVMFATLTLRTIIGIKESPRGSAGGLTRFQMVCTVNLLLTFVAFWTLLAPTAPRFYLLSYDNLSIHVIAPLLCLADYILFSEAKRLKHRDMYYTCIFPMFYLVAVTAAGFMGYDYGTHFVVTQLHSPDWAEGYIVPKRAPYFFLDFNESGIMVLAYIGGIIAFLLLLGYGFYIIDRKLRKSPVIQYNSHV
jgi:hypothetical protein